MLTEEQINNLNPGQEVYVKMAYEYIFKGKELKAKTKDCDGGDWTVYARFENVFLALPKDAAKAERDRLNAEYRKEQNHD